MTTLSYIQKILALSQIPPIIWHQTTFNKVDAGLSPSFRSNSQSDCNMGS